LTAYHEAGHAVVHLHFSHPLKRITIKEEGDAAGYVSHHYPSRLVEQIDLDQITPARRLRVEEEIIGSYAGQFALRRLGVRKWRTGAGQDERDAAELAWRVCGMENQRSGMAFMRWCKVRAEDLLARDDIWAAIKALASSLLQRGTISGRDARRIVQEALTTYWKPKR
jgi:hypothetical protein